MNLAELRKQTPLEQFRALGSAIDKMADANEPVATARAFFGRSGASLLSMFSAKGFGDAAKQVGTQAQILGRDAALFDDASDKLALAGTKLTGFFIGIADRVVPKSPVDPTERPPLSAYVEPGSVTVTRPLPLRS